MDICMVQGQVGEANAAREDAYTVLSLIRTYLHIHTPACATPGAGAVGGGVRGAGGSGQGASERASGRAGQGQGAGTGASG